MYSDEPEGYFEVSFIGKTASRYSENFIFKSGMTQEDILCYGLTDDVDGMMNYRDMVAESPAGQFRVFDQNPIHLGFFLSDIRQNGIYNNIKYIIYIYIILK